MIAILRNIFFRDFWLKLFSLVLATLIWLIVYLFAIKKDGSLSAALRSGITSERTFSNVPVVVVSASTPSRSFQLVPATVNVSVRGDRKEVESLQPWDVQALVVLSAEPTATITNKVSVTVPANITFISVDPTQVQVIPPKPQSPAP